MIFRVNVSSRQLERHTQYWDIAELTLEHYLITSDSMGVTSILDPDIFGEELFFVRSQARTTAKKRLDMLALDKNGNGSVIELKKDKGKLGVDTQALQYMADMSKYKGRSFLAKFGLRKREDDLRAFLHEDIDLDSINQRSRIILVARYFDEALLSMGEWLAENNVAFRCISFSPVLIGQEKYINFSVVFDQTTPSTRRHVEFSREQRNAQCFWHNIGAKNESWWKYLLNTGQISAGFDNEPGDRGESILLNYLKGDTVFAYVSRIGCVGYGVIDSNANQKGKAYKLVKPGSKEDTFPTQGKHLHRRSVEWKAAILDFSNAIPVERLKSEFNITHPIQTSSTIRSGETEILKTKLQQQNEL